MSDLTPAQRAVAKIFLALIIGLLCIEVSFDLQDGHVIGVCIEAWLINCALKLWDEL